MAVVIFFCVFLKSYRSQDKLAERREGEGAFYDGLNDYRDDQIQHAFLLLVAENQIDPK